MDSIGEYILSITAAGVICAIVKHIIGDKNFSAGIIKVVCGIFMAVTVLAPIVNIRLKNIENIFEEYQISGQTASKQGVIMANEAMEDIIKQQTEAYVWNEANRLGLNLDVSVTLSDAHPPIPVSVTLTGEISPYYKKTMSRFITENLGLAEENQIWM